MVSFPSGSTYLQSANAASWSLGGEASIWLAEIKGRKVVSREGPHPDDGDWEGKEGREILKASPPNQNHTDFTETP